MENLVFSLNATVPVFLMMVIGLVLRYAGLFSEEFAAKVNTFVFRIPMPAILEKTVTGIGSMASPLGLMAMGATFDIKKAFGRLKPAAVAAVIKLVGFAALFLPLAVWMGFRNEELVAILIMLTSATTVSGYVMARNMGHEGVLTASVVMLTTMFSAFTITFWLWLLRSLGLI